MVNIFMDLQNLVEKLGSLSKGQFLIFQTSSTSFDFAFIKLLLQEEYIKEGRRRINIKIVPGVDVKLSVPYMYYTV